MYCLSACGMMLGIVFAVCGLMGALAFWQAVSVSFVFSLQSQQCVGTVIGRS